MKHKQAELMALYAQDALTTEEPWRLWEYRCHSGNWSRCFSNPVWHTETEYRRESKKITINGVEIDAPMDTPPKEGEAYFAAIPTHSTLYIGFVWSNDYMDQKFFRRGLCHSTKEAAVAHAKALLSFTSQQP